MTKVDIDKRMKGKRNTNWFDKNPWNRNCSWRPRKSVSHVLKEMEKRGIKPVSQDEIKDVYLSLVNNTEKEMKDILEDNQQPMLTKLVIKAMMQGKWIDVLEKMFDRAIGKADQKMSVEQSVKASQITEEHIYDEKK